MPRALGDISLGDTVKDSVTGFEGVATSVIYTLGGAPNVEITPPAHRGHFVHPIFFNLMRVVRVSGVGGGQDVIKDEPTPGPTAGSGHTH